MTPSSAYLNPARACHWKLESQNRGDTIIWTIVCHSPSGEGHTVSLKVPLSCCSMCFVISLYKRLEQLPLSGCTLHQPHCLWRTLQGWMVKVKCQHGGESQREACSHTGQLSEKWNIKTCCSLSPLSSTFVDSRSLLELMWMLCVLCCVRLLSRCSYNKQSIVSSCFLADHQPWGFLQNQEKILVDFNLCEHAFYHKVELQVSLL